jgi:hypothetical protein
MNVYVALWGCVGVITTYLISWCMYVGTRGERQRREGYLHPYPQPSHTPLTHSTPQTPPPPPPPTHTTTPHAPDRLPLRRAQGHTRVARPFVLGSTGGPLPIACVGRSQHACAWGGRAVGSLGGWVGVCVGGGGRLSVGVCRGGWDGCGGAHMPCTVVCVCMYVCVCVCVRVRVLEVCLWICRRPIGHCHQPTTHCLELPAPHDHKHVHPPTLPCLQPTRSQTGHPVVPPAAAARDKSPTPRQHRYCSCCCWRCCWCCCWC